VDLLRDLRKGLGLGADAPDDDLDTADTGGGDEASSKDFVDTSQLMGISPTKADQQCIHGLGAVEGQCRTAALEDPDELIVGRNAPELPSA